MNERIEKIKNHIKEHKTAYILGGVGLGLAVFTCTSMRGRNIEVRPFSMLSKLENSQNTNIVSVLERSGRGHPGYLIRCKELNQTYPSQIKTAEIFGGAASILSDHINGKLPDFCGYHFERIPQNIQALR
jgi:hypothetical protein